MSKFVTKQGKQLLRNTIQSTNSQNKILEQNLMWKAQEKKDTTSYERRKRTLEDRYSEDDHDGDQPQSSNSNYWMKKLIKEEEKHPERWGHHGYKELYPNDFESDKSESDSSSEPKKEKTKKRKKKLKKEKKSKKAKKHKKHRRK